MAQQHEVSPDILALLVAATKAMGHPTRLRILAMLGSGPLCVCQLTAVLHLAASTVSGHLAELRRAGLVAERKSGKWVEYRLTTDGPAATLLASALAALRQDPQRRADAETVRALRTLGRETLCQAGLDLEAVGITRKPRRTAGGGRSPSSR
jgi:DNA-binding transcriptional ArsR family regulator